MKDIKQLISVKVKSMFEQNQLSDRMKIVYENKHENQMTTI